MQFQNALNIFCTEYINNYSMFINLVIGVDIIERYEP